MCGVNEIKVQVERVMREIMALNDILRSKGISAELATVLPTKETPRSRLMGCTSLQAASSFVVRIDSSDPKAVFLDFIKNRYGLTGAHSKIIK